MFIIKKLVSVFLAALLALSMAACSAKTPSEGGSSAPQQPEEPVKNREYNYITGEAFKDGESSTNRPVAVMIDNSKYALPQSGIEAADIIYEMVTEGGITRFMAVYSDMNKFTLAGPVRSARDQFVQFVLPLNAIYVHIGTSIYANDMLNYYKYQDIDGLYLGVTSFDFDKERAKYLAHEHCWYTKPNLVLDGINATGLSTTGNLNPAFNFADYNNGDITFEKGKAAVDITYRLSNYADAAFHFNSGDGRYYKDCFGAPQLDKDTGNQLSFDNVFLLYTAVGLYPDGLCTSFDFSKGDGYYFFNGEYIPVKWSKGSPENPLVITDENGEEIEVNPGKSYVAFIDNSMKETLVISETVPTPTPQPAA